MTRARHAAVSLQVNFGFTLAALPARGSPNRLLRRWSQPKSRMASSARSSIRASKDRIAARWAISQGWRVEVNFRCSIRPTADHRGEVVHRGCQHVLERARADGAGLRAVVLPASLLLLSFDKTHQEGAAVQPCHLSTACSMSAVCGVDASVAASRSESPSPAGSTIVKVEPAPSCEATSIAPPAS